MSWRCSSSCQGSSGEGSGTARSVSSSLHRRHAKRKNANRALGERREHGEERSERAITDPAPSPFSRPSGHVSALTGSLAGSVMPLCQLCTHLPPAPGAFWTSGDTKQHTVLLLCQVGTLFFVVVGVFFCYFFRIS